MKKILFLLVMFFSALLAAATGPEQKKLKLPEKIYAVGGVECNIYFRQVFMTINPANYAFFVRCLDQ